MGFGRETGCSVSCVVEVGLGIEADILRVERELRLLDVALDRFVVLQTSFLKSKSRLQPVKILSACRF